MAKIIKVRTPSGVVRFPDNTTRRRKLWNTNPCCHWCGIKTSLIHVSEGVKPPNEMATVDHIISRYTRESRYQFHSEENVVLACNKCNNDRADVENKERKGETTITRKVPDYSFDGCVLPSRSQMVKTLAHG